MLKKYLALILTVIILTSSFTSVSVFADDTTTETIPMQTIATDSFSTSDYKSSWGTQISSSYVDANAIAGTGWASNWLEKTAEGNVASTTASVKAYPAKGASTDMALQSKADVVIARELGKTINLNSASAKYTFKLDVKSTHGVGASRQPFALLIGGTLEAGYTVNATDSNIVPYIKVGENEAVPATTTTTLGGQDSGAFTTLELTVELNSDGNDIVTLTATDNAGTASTVTTTADVTGSSNTIYFDMYNAFIDNITIKGADYEAVNNTKALYDGIAGESVASESFLYDSQYKGNRYGNDTGGKGFLYNTAIYVTEADGVTPIITGSGFATNWMSLGSDGELEELTADNSSAVMYYAYGDGKDTSNVAALSKSKETIGRKLLNDITFADSGVKYVFSLKNKGTSAGGGNTFFVKIGNVFEAGYEKKTINEAAAMVPYIKVNGATVYAEDSVSPSGSGGAPGNYNTVDISVYPGIDSDDVISITVTDTAGATATVTTSADLTGAAEYLAFGLNYHFIDDIYVTKYDRATLPQDDDPTEEDALYPMEDIASETFLSNDYNGVYAGGWNSNINTKIKSDTTGTGWIGKWLEKDANGKYADSATDNIIPQLYFEYGESGMAARYFHGDATLYRQLASPISFENIRGKYIFTVGVKYISGFTDFRYIINDSLTVGFNSTTAVPFILLNEGTENEKTVTAINKIAVKENSSNTFSTFKVILDLNKDEEDTITVRVSTDGKNAGVTTTADLTGTCTHIGIDSAEVWFDNISIKGVDYSYYEISESEIPYEYDIYPVTELAEETIATEDYNRGKASNSDSTGVDNVNVVNAYTKVFADDGETEIDKITGTGWNGNWFVKDSDDTNFRAPADADSIRYLHESDTAGHVIFLNSVPAGTTAYRLLQTPIVFGDTEGKYIFSVDVKNGYGAATGKSNFRFKIGDNLSVGYNAATLIDGTPVVEAGGRTFTAPDTIALGPSTGDASVNYYMHFDVEVYLKETGRDIIKVSITRRDEFNRLLTGQQPVTFIAAADLTGTVEYIGIGSKPTSNTHCRIDNIKVSGISGEEMEKLARVEVQNGEFKSKDGLKLLDTSKITDSIVYSFNLFNYFKEEKSADVFMGVYYDGKLAGIKSLSATVPAKSVSETLTIGFADSLPEGSKENISVKVLVWEKDTFVPYTDRIDMYSQSDRAVVPEIFGADTTEPVVVAFMGDSITHLNPSYTKWIEYYYRIKYPTKDIRFVSKGISGDSAGGNLGRFDWDIYDGVGTGTPTEACIMIGMNDIGRSLYPNGSEEDKQARIDTCLANIEAIADKCAEKGIKLTLITPTLYDEADYSGASSENNVGVNAGLGKIAERVIKLANEKNLAYIDFYGYINSFNSALRSGEFANQIIFNKTDRIHAEPVGTFAEGFIFIDQQINDPIIASVDIDVNTLAAETDSAVVENIDFADGTLSYTYAPASLPMYTTEEYVTCNDTYGIPVTDSINREIIKVSGLAEGSYKIMFGEEDLGTYTAAQLAEGVNIATIATNPGQVQSEAVYDLVTQKMGKDYVLRNIAYVEQAFPASVDKTDVQACVDYFNNTNKFSGSNDSRYLVYVENKENQATVIEEIAQLEAQAKTAAQPGTYNVQIIKQ